MRPSTKILLLTMLAAFMTANGSNYARYRSVLPGDSLCAANERAVFSCRTRSSAKSRASALRKIVSLCASPDLNRERGYLQYRYGLPGKVELEFPSSIAGTQQLFQYTHYMRYQIDFTEISFQIDGYEYQIFDTYNGEEKPAIAEQGVSVSAPGKTKEVSFTCVGKAKADYSLLDGVLSTDQP